MIEIGGKPLLWHLMKSFSQKNINEFIVALGYKSEVIKKYFIEYSRLQSNLSINLATGQVKAEQKFKENWQVDLIETGEETMTGGRLLRLKDFLKETFIFTYGDGLSDIDFHKLIQFHKSHGKLATVTAVTPKQRFGVLKLGENNQVTSFAEKPDVKNDFINGGFFILEPEVINYIDNDQTIWEKDPCENLAKDNQMVAYQHHGFWQCVDTLHELRQLRQLWDSGDAMWKTW